MCRKKQSIRKHIIKALLDDSKYGCVSILSRAIVHIVMSYPRDFFMVCLRQKRDVTWHDMAWHDMAWHDVTGHDMTWHYITRRDMILQDVMWLGIASSLWRRYINIKIKVYWLCECSIKREFSNSLFKIYPIIDSCVSLCFIKWWLVSNMFHLLPLYVWYSTGKVTRCGKIINTVIWTTGISFFIRFTIPFISVICFINMHWSFFQYHFTCY